MVSIVKHNWIATSTTIRIPQVELNTSILSDFYLPRVFLWENLSLLKFIYKKMNFI